MYDRRTNGKFVNFTREGTDRPEASGKLLVFEVKTSRFSEQDDYYLHAHSWESASVQAASRREITMYDTCRPITICYR